MTRFQCVALAALLCSGLVMRLGWWTGLIVIWAGFFLLLGLGVALPHWRYFGPFICAGHTQQPQVALTFDDGPDLRSTPKLLEVLRHHQVEAAFFAIGCKVAAAPALANQILRDGHLLENHSFAHSYATNLFPARKLTADLKAAQRTIEKHTGTTPRYFRPPVGLSNPNTFRVARALRLKVVGWSIRSLDTRQSDPERVVRRIMRRVKPGAIILLHDGGIPADQLTATVQLLLAKLREQGYEIVRLDRMLT
ncbi:MAG TPA: polysaccharide deacetylase family protein [Verrucomicrobiota bacterium]|nr:polysaccharide deacetylase family protein [Verrucomicrobiota bacterium]HNT15089.1 polysaccharide deacetylase family protein [Verrucomicrobiota bacterium]